MEDTNTIPEPITETVEPAAIPEVTIAPEIAVEAPQEAVQSEETPAVETAPIAQCDSCGASAELFDVPHHQVGNATVWHYCARCKAVHDKEMGVIEALKEVAKTHPIQADTPKVAGMLHEGKGVEEVKAELDRTRQPELEAEIIE